MQKAGFGGFDRIADSESARQDKPDARSDHLQLDRFGDVVTNKFEAWMANPARDVDLSPREVVVQADHLIAGLHQPIDQMGAEKAGPSSDEVDLHPRG